MSTPHDYYEFGPHPHLHNKGEGKPYLEPDYFANWHDAALPALSTIGRGPRGEGITAERTEDGRLVIKSDLTGDVLAQFSLGDWSITIVPAAPTHIEEGQNSYFNVVVSDGSRKRTEKIVVPCGERGDRIFLKTGDHVEYREDQTYQLAKDSLITFDAQSGNQNTPTTHIPEPRVGDVAIMLLTSGDWEIPAIAYCAIKEVGENTVVVVAETVYDFYHIINYASLDGLPTINNVQLLGNKTTADLGLFSGDYNDLTDKPELFSGSYDDLTNKPDLFSGSYSDLTHQPVFEYGANTLEIDGRIKINEDLGVPFINLSREDDAPRIADIDGAQPWPTDYDTSHSDPADNMSSGSFIMRSITKYLFNKPGQEGYMTIGVAFEFECEFYDDADWSDILGVKMDEGPWIPICYWDFGSFFWSHAIAAGSAHFTTTDGSVVSCPIRVVCTDTNDDHPINPAILVRVPDNAQTIQTFASVYVSGMIYALPWVYQE